MQRNQTDAQRQEKLLARLVMVLSKSGWSGLALEASARRRPAASGSESGQMVSAVVVVAAPGEGRGGGDGHPTARRLGAG